MRKMTQRDINNFSFEFAKMHIGYTEKCGMARALEIMGYITENTYLLLADNFEMQAYENIPVGAMTFKHILERGIR